jgi:hypothetical protein
MNTKKIYFPLIITALFMLLSSDIMALTIPGFPSSGGGSTPAPAGVLIFTCKNTSTDTSSSCSSSGGSGSSCSSGTGSAAASRSHIVSWESTSDEPLTLKNLLNDLNTTCSEAVEAVGIANCTPSGETVYTCRR